MLDRQLIQQFVEKGFRWTVVVTQDSGGLEPEAVAAVANARRMGCAVGCVFVGVSAEALEAETRDFGLALARACDEAEPVVEDSITMSEFGTDRKFTLVIFPPINAEIQACSDREPVERP